MWVEVCSWLIESYHIGEEYFIIVTVDDSIQFKSTWKFLCHEVSEFSFIMTANGYSYENIWADGWEKGPKNTCDQRRSRPACASAQSGQDIHCSPAQYRGHVEDRRVPAKNGLGLRHSYMPLGLFCQPAAHMTFVDTDTHIGTRFWLFMGKYNARRGKMALIPYVLVQSDQRLSLRRYYP